MSGYKEEQAKAKLKAKFSWLVGSTTVAIPCYNNLPYEFFDSLNYLQLEQGDLLETVNGTNLHKVRNQLVEKMVGDYILFIDSDMTFPPDIVQKLKAKGKDIISAICFQKEYPFAPTMMKKLEGKNYEPVWEWKEGELVECDAVGMAVTLIHRRVFEKMKKPYFEYLLADDGSLYGEDVSFCMKAKELGFTVWCDTSVSCGHVSQQVVGENMYWFYKQLREEGKIKEDIKDKLIKGEKNARNNADKPQDPGEPSKPGSEDKDDKDN